MNLPKNKRCLVTGGAGSIGSELVRQLSKENKVFVIDNNETGLFEIMNETGCFGRVGDIRDEKVVWDVFSDFKPQLVFHAAALKHVPLNELYPDEAVKTNILGTLNVIKEAKNWECLEKFVFISTDKAVQSTSVMGATKRCAEIIVKNQGDKFIVVRFGNVLGSRGSVVPIWQKQVDNGKKITITDEKAKRYMMTIEEACSLVIKAAQEGKGGEIFILDMGEQINILDLAKQIVKGKNIDIEITGLRKGEVLEEKLMFEEEEKRAIKQDNYYIIK